MTLLDLWTHLWQSTLFAALVALLTLAFRHHGARWRYRLWLAASIKFLVPFSVLVDLGSRFGLHAVHRAAAPVISFFAEGIGRPLLPPALHPAAALPSPAPVSSVPALVLALWLCGCAAVLFRWGLSWRRVQAAVRAATAVTEGREHRALRSIEQLAGLRRPVKLLSSAGQLEPGVFGIFRPKLMWPAGMSERLAGAQLEAILAHEVCHVRRRDNLASAAHMAVEAIFWFHPLVWWLGARLVAERENACDEEVLRLGSEPHVYAEGILKTCRFCLESPLVCMAGVTGADLKQRIERIMTQRIGQGLDRGRKLLLAIAGLAALAVPVVFGMLHPPAVRAQSQPAARPSFEVASIKPDNSGDRRVRFQLTPGGRMVMTNASPKMLIMMAYNLKPDELKGGPNWIDSVRYDITAKASRPASGDQMKEMVQSLLEDRFQLKFHHETKEMPIYALVVGKHGPKLKASEVSGERKSMFRVGRGEMNLDGANMPALANALSNLVGRTVLDRTGLSGTYDIRMQWTPDVGEAPMMKGPPGAPPAGSGEQAPESGGPSIFTAIQEQLGLRLEAQKGPVQVMVIDHIEKASAN